MLISKSDPLLSWLGYLIQAMFFDGLIGLVVFLIVRYFFKQMIS